MMKSLLRSFVLGAALAAASSIGSAHAEYPDKPITIVVPNNPGGSTDLTARLFAEALQGRFSVPVTVVNKPGGGTSVGAREVKDSVPDGHTVLMIHQAMLTAAATGISDFGPDAFKLVAMTGVDPSILVVKGDSPYASLVELLAEAKENPDTLKAGVNIGALNHFALMAVEQAGEGEFRFVHTGGGGPSVTALLGGHIDLTYLTLSDAMQYHQSGDLRILAVFLPERHSAAADLPTAVEQGFDLVLPIKHMWWMPADTPDERVDAFAAALEDAMQEQNIRQVFEQNLTVPVFASGSALRDELAEEYSRIEELARSVELEGNN